MPSHLTILRAVARIALGLASLAWVSIGHAQTALEPQQGGTDFLIQGEYAGKPGTATPFASQVIAPGGGQFQAVFLTGGLPGQGWDGSGRVEVPGSLQPSNQAVFSGSGYSAAITADGLAMKVKAPAGDSLVLNKVMRESPTANAPPPEGAEILFDGSGVSAWKAGTASMDSRKLFKPEGPNESSGAISQQTFQSFTLHLEFREPFMPAARDQARGNSGIYLQNRDEMQILDSFGKKLDNGADTMAAKRECGAFFEYFRPSLNIAFPPLSWQTFDIYFTAGRYDAAGKIQIEPPYATVLWNGVTVQDKRALVNSTLLGDPQGPAAGPLRFQSHGDSIYFRNIWVIDGVSAVKRRSGMLPAQPTPLNQASFAGSPRLDGRMIPASGRQAEPNPDRTAFGWYLIPDGSGKRNMRIWGK